MPQHVGVPSSVADLPANQASYLVHAVECLGRSEQKRAVFEAVYYHKKKIKSVGEIAAHSGLSRLQVLQAGNPLVKAHLMGQTVKDSQTAYVQHPVYQGLKRRILSLVENPKKSERIATKERPRVSVTVRTERVRARAPKTPSFITIDAIESFSKVRGVAPVANGASSMPEDQFKAGIQQILGETGRFKDWGGELSDVYTTTLELGRKRRRAAFAFKGPGKKGVLRPKNMGRNGDQIERLFRSPADDFLVQYHGQIHESVLEEMELRARQLAADANKPVWYGIIDGRDSNRLIAAYPKSFARNKK
jgi:hypothetical protein